MNEKNMKKQVRLIWHWDVSDVPNRDWIRFLLSDVVSKEIVDLRGEICQPYSIVVEDNRSATPARFFENAVYQRPMGLFHIADEYFSFDYSKYKLFDFVIKIYWSSAFNADGICVVPIGYQSGLSFAKPFAPASQRPLLWSFAGGLKSSRYEMVRVLRDVEPNCICPIASREQRLPKRQYVNLLATSVFSPCPMGNVTMESYRLYESLESGCIPIIEKRPFLRYYENLLRFPPFMFVRSWREARQRMLDLSEDHAELDHLQRSVHSWWETYKSDLKDRVSRHVAEGFARAANLTEGGIRVKRIAEVPGWHYAELLRHQSLASLRWRLQRNLLGGRLKAPF